ncbi:MAG: hypothetical protein ABJA67_01075, partial [Chthonomonadales bacterium]
YRIAVHKAGFADAVRDSVTVTTGQILRVDFSIQVSSRAEQVTVRGLTIVRIDSEKNIVLVKGAVPGANGGFLTISKI